MQDAEYSVMPNPHSPLDSVIADLYSKTRIDLTTLYRGGNPFTADSSSQGTNASPDASQAPVSPAEIEQAVNDIFPDAEPAPTPREQMEAGLGDYQVKK